MKIFNLETKKHVVGWSVFLTIFLWGIYTLKKLNDYGFSDYIVSDYYEFSNSLVILLFLIPIFYVVLSLLKNYNIFNVLTTKQLFYKSLSFGFLLNFFVCLLTFGGTVTCMALGCPSGGPTMGWPFSFNWENFNLPWVQPSYPSSDFYFPTEAPLSYLMRTKLEPLFSINFWLDLVFWILVSLIVLLLIHYFKSRSRPVAGTVDQ